MIWGTKVHYLKISSFVRLSEVTVRKIKTLKDQIINIWY